ncbi:dihydrolipoyl dehydrogenase [Tessaracoccus sp. ZS01]|uniref:dihydrolipoyl dehydrogenase n=1 Tax=Tessaracoccus sp. ZS01 TaxID=1906324 RepID=UPI00096BE20A|nr:dihydrolipoyl dehydrogenase [Tessaracoccus sp. ZS01]MCG6568092.1 dihydrolipoyl dehydrogenase [Tessaracoccus sp. ZS01]OMG54170.1 dihydrolipoyl dehydrogenase [Tessaracoccus sp. ZS01]
MNEFDVIVLGGGPGGYIAAERLGHAKKKVLLVEADALGGTCLNVGCIPTKALLNAAKTYAHAKHGAKLGVNAGDISVDWPTMQKWKKQTVDTLVGGVGQAEKKAGVTVVKGHGTFDGPGKVTVDGTQYSGKHVILATGSVPVMPPIPGSKDNPKVVDSTGMLAIEEIPARLAVIGGGVIGLEFASLFAMLGSEVTVVEMLPEIVPFMDDELAAQLRKGLADVKFKLECKVTAIDGGTVKYVTLAGAEESVEADVVLMAVGRRPLVQGWGAESSGLEFSGKGIVVDDRMRTNLPNVWAVGDVTGRSLLAHAAYRMGEIAVANILDPEAHRRGEIMRWNTIPWAVYSAPEAAGIGLTEKQAAAAGYTVGKVVVPAYLSGRFVAEEGVKAPGACKLVYDADSLTVLGVHVLGSYASEMVWGASVVLETELSITDLRQVVFPHPTVSELIREAAWAAKI